MSSTGGSQWTGRPHRRLEDERLLLGSGRYTDDLSLEGEAHAHFVRSPHARARIVKIETAGARAASGVLAVYTGADLLQAGLAPLPFTQMHKRPDGANMTVPPRYALSVDEARFVGDAVAMVVAESAAEARDAAERVEVDWDPLPAVADLDTASSGAGPAVWQPAFTKEHGNIAAVYRRGDRAVCDAAFAAAANVVRLRVTNQRVVANPLEPRAMLARFDRAQDRYILRCTTQNVHTVRGHLAAVLGVPEGRIQVICADLGGGFGTRGYAYPEHAAVCFAARALARPIKWRADRSENFLSEVHGRDSVSTAELALDTEGRFVALRVRTLANVGAYVSHFGACVPAMSGARAVTSVYAIPLLDHEVRMLFTNTVPVDAYRGAGRPEIGYLMERLIARAARELGEDPVELRLKNMVRPEQMPYTNAAGYVCDSGNFPKLLRDALSAADWDGFPARKKQALARGNRYGRGLACYVENTGSARLTETVGLAFAADDTVTLISGTQPIGQGIQTSYAQVLADRLGIAPQAVRVLQGDSDVAKTGGGAGAARSLQVGGSAALRGAEVLIEAGKKLAADALDAAPSDIEFTAGAFRIAGTDRSIGFAALAARQPERRIGIEHTETVLGQTWPNGCQVCEVEVDPETGVVQVVRLTAVDDIGRVINPLIAEGQIHGGMAQGIGQALLEHSIYDDAGQMLTGSFMDYCMPRADAIPPLHTTFDETAQTRINPLGAKGAGELGCHGAPPAIVNAVLDALPDGCTIDLDMPLTAEKVWRAIRTEKA